MNLTVEIVNQKLINNQIDVINTLETALEGSDNPLGNKYIVQKVFMSRNKRNS